MSLDMLSCEKMRSREELVRRYADKHIVPKPSVRDEKRIEAIDRILSSTGGVRSVVDYSDHRAGPPKRTPGVRTPGVSKDRVPVPVPLPPRDHGMDEEHGPIREETEADVEEASGSLIGRAGVRGAAPPDRRLLVDNKKILGDPPRRAPGVKPAPKSGEDVSLLSPTARKPTATAELLTEARPRRFTMAPQLRRRFIDSLVDSEPPSPTSPGEPEESRPGEPEVPPPPAGATTTTPRPVAPGGGTSDELSGERTCGHGPDHDEDLLQSPRDEHCGTAAAQQSSQVLFSPRQTSKSFVVGAPSNNKRPTTLPKAPAVNKSGGPSRGSTPVVARTESTQQESSSSTQSFLSRLFSGAARRSTIAVDLSKGTESRKGGPKHGPPDVEDEDSTGAVPRSFVDVVATTSDVVAAASEQDRRADQHDHARKMMPDGGGGRTLADPVELSVSPPSRLAGGGRAAARGGVGPLDSSASVSRPASSSASSTKDDVDDNFVANDLLLTEGAGPGGPRPTLLYAGTGGAARTGETAARSLCNTANGGSTTIDTVRRNTTEIRSPGPPTNQTASAGGSSGPSSGSSTAASSAAAPVAVVPRRSRFPKPINEFSIPTEKLFEDANLGSSPDQNVKYRADAARTPKKWEARGGSRSSQRTGAGSRRNSLLSTGSSADGWASRAEVGSAADALRYQPVFRTPYGVLGPAAPAVDVGRVGGMGHQHGVGTSGRFSVRQPPPIFCQQPSAVSLGLSPNPTAGSLRR